MKKNNQGKDKNFFARVNITDGYFPDDSQIDINIKWVTSFSLVNEGDSRVEYSFNGNHLHGDLTPGTSTEAIFFDNRRISAIWFRTNAATAQRIRVEAWSYT